MPAEPSFPIERVKTMMEEANVKTIITQTKFNERFKGMDLTDLDDLKKVKRMEAILCGSKAKIQPIFYILPEAQGDRKVFV